MYNLLAVAAVAALSSASVGAVTFTSTAGAPDPGPAVGQTVVFDFETATPELTGSYALVTGTVQGQYAAPALDTTQYAVVPMPGQGNGTATLDVSGVAIPYNSFSFYWGSIDEYNDIELLDGLGNVFFTIDGSQLPPADGDQGDAQTNRRVFVRLGANDVLGGIRFNSQGVAFEFDDVAFGVVPEPASWALMIAGFGLVGLAARRRTKALAA